MEKITPNVPEHAKPREAGPGQEEVESAILKAVRSIRFGSVEIVVHDSQVVQIECRNKVRFHPGSPKAGLE